MEKKIQLLPCCWLIKVTSIFLTDSGWRPINIHFHRDIIQSLLLSYIFQSGVKIYKLAPIVGQENNFIVKGKHHG